MLRAVVLLVVVFTIVTSLIVDTADVHFRLLSQHLVPHSELVVVALVFTVVVAVVLLLSVVLGLRVIIVRSFVVTFGKWTVGAVDVIPTGAACLGQNVLVSQRARRAATTTALHPGHA